LLRLVACHRLGYGETYLVEKGETMRRCLWIAPAGILVSACEDRGVNVLSDVPTDYSIDQAVSSFCPHRGVQVRVFAKSDTIADAISLADDTSLSRSMWGRYRTIEGLFEQIVRADTSSWSADHAMDSTNTYPARLSLRPKANITDVSITYVTWNLTELHK
jgi:hypothetical protein